jgi:hypothetical protein
MDAIIRLQNVVKRYRSAWDVFRVTVDLHLLLMAMWAFTIALIGTLPLAFRTVRETEMHALQDL